MASAEFTEDSEEKRPTVQVGDPFTEKLLIEACLELMQKDAIVAIQDMGAAGLTSSSVEMASKGDVGFELNLNNVPQREEHMTPYEMMLSESQERMLMVLKPGHEGEAEAIFRKWDLDFAVIGEITDTGNLTLTFDGDVVADIPVAPLTDLAPEYDRPWVPSEPKADIKAEDVAAPADLGDALLKMMGSPHLASRKWIWEQYDHMVMGDTIQRPGGDAAMVRVHGTEKGLAISTDCTPRYCYADPVQGGRQAVAETWRNITATGATPLAITNCLNFGNPERPEIMGQFVECLKGMGEACIALDYPVVSGNVSLYNETNGTGIHPTPAIGGVGLIADTSKMTTIAPKAEGEVLVLIGGGQGHLGASLYLDIIESREDGGAPEVDLDKERHYGDFVREQILGSKVSACHDISDGGLLVALTEMSLASSIGFDIDLGDNLPIHAAAFGEDQARYILSVTAAHAEQIVKDAQDENIPASILGKTQGTDLIVKGQMNIPLQQVLDLHRNWMPEYMRAEHSA